MCPHLTASIEQDQEGIRAELSRPPWRRRRGAHDRQRRPSPLAAAQGGSGRAADRSQQSRRRGGGASGHQGPDGHRRGSRPCVRHLERHARRGTDRTSRAGEEGSAVGRLEISYLPRARLVYIEDVGGSSPSSPTKFSNASRTLVSATARAERGKDRTLESRDEDVVLVLMIGD